MLTASTLKIGLNAISRTMTANRQYLIELDQRNGDGDLGVSMDEGFAAACLSINDSTETDLGRLLVTASKAFNEAAPSTLGTIFSLYMMGSAKVLKGKQEADAALASEACEAGVAKVMERAGSKPGEKTVLDALAPAAAAMKAHAAEGMAAAIAAAAQAAREGSDSTANMKAVHGRAAYYGDKTIGLVDGGAVAGKLIFEALVEALKSC